MTAERFQQLRTLFDAAVERQPAERARYLEEACPGDPALRSEVARLLEAHESGAPLLEAPADPPSREGTRVGPYEILREIGRGGMGTVYLARRADEMFQRMVAVKILRADVANQDLIRRFQREREILAALDHPNVTRLLDGGTTADGLPFFVMEYVQGVPIGTYCDEAQLPLEDRLRLFEQVCDAVAYAHSHGVVHRDLKPGNILVANGQAKVLDFGIARLIRGEINDETLTAASLMVMTPQYASPEQVRGEAATRESDVYALGVILYELLTARSPYHLRSRAYHEMVQVVCEEPPARPSSAISNRMSQMSLDEWKEQLRGNLDAVILKALSKDPADRYRSPALLKDELERHLNGEAVWAQDPWWGQRALLLVSRHRALVICLIAAIAAVFFGAVKLEANAIYFAAGAGLLVALWYAATSRELGRKIAASLTASQLVGFFIAAILLMPLVFWGREGARRSPAIDLLLLFAALLPVAYVVVFLFREWWSGARLCKLSAGKPLWIFYTVVVIGEAIEAHFNGKLAAVGITTFIATHSTWIVAAVIMFLSSQREVRQKGIFLGGGLVRWSGIRSWSWEIGSGDTERSRKFVTLRLDLYRRIQFLPPVRVPVDINQRAALDSIFTRYLGDWPS